MAATPVAQEVTDISDADQLLRYAAAGQLARLLDERRFLNNGLIAQGAGFSRNKRVAGQELARAMKKRLSAKQLIGLDEIIGALAREQDGAGKQEGAGKQHGLGGLSSLALRLSMERDRIDVSSLIAHVPPSWTSRLLQGPPADEIGALTQASAVLAAFQATGKMDTKGLSEDAVRDRFSEDLGRLVRRLVAVSGSPPTARNYDAQVLLGLLASYSFDSMKLLLERELKYSPLGYRVWRAITKLVTLSELHGSRAAALRVWVRTLLEESDELRDRSIYAGRALDMELATAVPADWSPPGKDDWVSRLLLQRARNKDVTLRERGAAALGLWERAVRIGDQATLKQARGDLGALSKEFGQYPGQRSDCPGGLPWIAATLDQVIESGDRVCNDWPTVPDAWYQRVHRAAQQLDGEDIPAHLLAGTKNLFLHMILQNAATYCSLAVETVVTSGWTGPVARALGYLLDHESEAWVRIRAEAALGLLQRPNDDTTRAHLIRACHQAFESLEIDKIPEDGQKAPEDTVPARALRTEMHACLYAVGDCYGAPGAEARAGAMRDELREMLRELATMKGPRARILRRPARAAAYLLTVTAQPGPSGSVGGDKDFAEEMLEELARHPDPVTSRFSIWALGFRFPGDGSVRPLVAAAEQPLVDAPFHSLPPLD
jgi:hypothetical protein